MRWVGHAEYMGKGRSIYRVLVGTREGKRTLGRSRDKWEDSCEMDLRNWDGGT